MLVKTTAKRTYWLIFRPGSHWYTPLLKRDYGHVFVLTNDGKQWLQLDPVKDYLAPCIIDRIDVNLPKLIARQRGYSVIKITLNELDTKRSILRPFYFISCVEIVKYIIGLRLFCVTPYGLYRKLCKLAKRLIKPYGIDNIEIIY